MLRLPSSYSPMASSSSTLHNFTLARYQPDGSPDATFGTGGVVTTDLGGDEEISALVLQPDGQLVDATYNSSTSSHTNFALARYQPDGSLDPTFGTGGLVTTDLGGDDSIGALVLQPDGKLVAAGSTRDSSTSSSNFALARYQRSEEH